MTKWLIILVAVAVGAGAFAADEIKTKEAPKASVNASVVKLTKSNFDKIVKAEDVVLVDFWASWCGPCRVQGPILDKVASSVGSSAVIGKVNVDEQAELAQKYGIQSIPTLIVFKNGEINQRLVGVHQEADLVAMIEKLK